jgi:hypothetical protein
MRERALKTYAITFLSQQTIARTPASSEAWIATSQNKQQPNATLARTHTQKCVFFALCVRVCVSVSAVAVCVREPLSVWCTFE